MKRPIVFFDLETTGVNTEKDRIVEIAVIKHCTDGTIEQKSTLINPERLIPKEASDVHGITNEMVAEKPTFKQISKSMYAFMEGCDFGGFNHEGFDLPLLAAEFARVGIVFPNWEFNTVDVMKLYRKLYPNTLGGIYKRIVGKELEDAHEALADVKATIDIYNIIKIETGLETVAEIDDYVQGEKKRFDLSGKCYVDVDGVVKWSSGKNKDIDVTKDKGYLDWVYRSDFPAETKQKLMDLMIEKGI